MAGKRRSNADIASGALPAIVVVLAAAAFGLVVALVSGLGASPAGWQLGLALVVAVGLGFAATPAVRDAYAEFVGARGSSARGWPGPVRIAVVALAVVVLALICWVHWGEPGRVLFSLARALVGLFAYALPVLPLFALLPTAATSRVPVPWGVLRRRDRAEYLRLARVAAGAATVAVLGRWVGVALVTTGLFHLLRGAPGTAFGAHRLAGGLIGMAVAGPLAALLSNAAALALLFAVLVCAALVITGHLYRHLTRWPSVAALALLIVVPLVSTGVSHHVGYDHYLGVRDDRVVVIAGLSPIHRQEVEDAGVALVDVPAAMRDVLRGGLRVKDPADGRNIAKGLADPAQAAAESLQDGGLKLKAGECFTFVGGSSGFRYTAPCNGEHTGEVFYVGRLPFRDNPGTQVRDAAARGICEKSYGGYLGVPFGSSYLPMEAPVVQGGGWQPKPLVACVFGTVGPWSLKGTRTIAALAQPGDWSPGEGCKATPESGLKVAAEAPNARCVAPGKAARLDNPGPAVIDAEFAPLGRAAGNGRVGLACLDADATTGYYATVGGDGILELVKQTGAERVKVQSAGKARASSSPSPQTAITPVQLSCKPVEGGTQVDASAGNGRKIAFTDQTAPVTRYAPRLVVEAAEAPVTATVSLFAAVLPGA
ncbi:hypothetical protein Val02_33040 [Virgisporangium aliadipatigenens]|uniref:Uncharacterized protein n=1 Tax=Virgisporangium aliadipatigenens TaxID=741659 RepID=A0A8J3YMF2_9ACTN|nr:hypothetical protein [Virgisporangium aliadipatigenens]GIJ46418.1 hypothetical protein Val02_33040 [Virgisporangium aliadipatigenens]